MTEVTLVFFRVAWDLDCFDGRRVQLCRRTKILLAFQKSPLSPFHFIADEKHVGHPIVWLAWKKNCLAVRR
jgi:hypothetical protein